MSIHYHFCESFFAQKIWRLFWRLATGELHTAFGKWRTDLANLKSFLDHEFGKCSWKILVKKNGNFFPNAVRQQFSLVENFLMKSTPSANLIIIYEKLFRTKVKSTAFLCYSFAFILLGTLKLVEKLAKNFWTFKKYLQFSDRIYVAMLRTKCRQQVERCCQDSLEIRVICK